jgi:hypothetical protein
MCGRGRGAKPTTCEQATKQQEEDEEEGGSCPKIKNFYIFSCGEQK